MNPYRKYSGWIPDPNIRRISVTKSDDNAIAKIILGFLSIPFLLFLRAWVLSKLWLWFVVPLGVLELGIAQAYGISILINLFTIGLHQNKENNEDNNSIVMSIFIKSVGISLFSLLFGYITYQFM